jgi:hypothetical protein
MGDGSKNYERDDERERGDKTGNETENSEIYI